MKGFLMAMFSFVFVFAVAFCFVGCNSNNAYNGITITETDVVGVYKVKAMSIKENGSTNVYTIDDYLILATDDDRTADENALLVRLHDTFALTLEFKADKTCVQKLGSETQEFTWSIVNNQIIIIDAFPDDYNVSSSFNGNNLIFSYESGFRILEKIA